jgi:Zn-dependent peptidase ImmA (M78 family)
MNSTTRGKKLEQAIFALLKSEIDADRFLARSGNCKIFLRKGYYSKDRKSEIVFDVAIEIFLPHATSPSMLILIECKNYSSGTVSVDEVEEFYAKAQQVAASKAIVASSTAFQSGAREFAKSKKMGLMRYLGPDNFKWELRRSPSASVKSVSASELNVGDGLSNPGFRSDVFDFYCQSPIHATTSLWSFFQALLCSDASTQDAMRWDEVPNRTRVGVRFRSKAEMEAIADDALQSIQYAGGAVSLEALCARERKEHGLIVSMDVPLPRGWPDGTLGRIQFEPLQIEIFRQARVHHGQQRFTLAHELAHHLLQHGRYLRQEFCTQEDFVLRRSGLDNWRDVVRLENQANYVASNLLLPKRWVVLDFWELVSELQLLDRGKGPLYVDDQPCNLKSYQYVTSILGGLYEVSRAAVRIRLEGLGLLRDERAAGRRYARGEIRPEALCGV